MKKILALVAIIGTIASTATAHAAETTEFYKDLSNELNIIQVYDTNDITYDLLVNRNGNILIERTIGQVLNENGDGLILNTDDDYYNYISYRSVKDAQVGDIILTYFIYNPDTSYEDDILDRFDYIIDRTGAE